MNIPQVKKAEFFDSSDLRELSDNTREAMEIFFAYEGHNFTWGTANRTLIDIDTFLENLENALDSTGDFEKDGGGVHHGFKELQSFLWGYRHRLYIDLEN